ncbi:MAG: glutathione S-transferase family protein [bacterium]|nr:glutathione S-transferase family protein [bacterium]
MIECYAFRMVPPFAQGLVRDLRVRWALEEAALPYRIVHVDIDDGGDAMPRSTYREVQPFGQIPALRDGELRLFESGAIVLYLAERCERLLPRDAAGRARVTQWMFAAIDTMENPIQELAGIDLFHADEAWAQARRPAVVDAVRRRLAELAAALGGREHLAGAFSAADVLMATVLRILRHTDLVAEQPVLTRYLERCVRRPAFTKALADQMGDFTQAA